MCYVFFWTKSSRIWALSTCAEDWMSCRVKTKSRGLHTSVMMGRWRQRWRFFPTSSADSSLGSENMRVSRRTFFSSKDSLKSDSSVWQVISDWKLWPAKQTVCWQKLWQKSLQVKVILQEFRGHTENTPDTCENLMQHSWKLRHCSDPDGVSWHLKCHLQMSLFYYFLLWCLADIVPLRDK